METNWHIFVQKTEQFFVLHSIRGLKQLSCDDSIESYSIDVQYLKQKIANFSEGEKSVTLLIYEVCTTNRIKYQNINRTFVGLTQKMVHVLKRF